MKRSLITHLILSSAMFMTVILSCYVDPTATTSTGSSQSGKCTYTDELTKNDLTWGIMDAVKDIYNQNVAFQSSIVNKTVNCPVGGTVKITGTATSNSGSTTVNLKYEMAGCKVMSVSSDKSLQTSLTMNGTINEKGFWNSTSKSLSYSAAPLSYAGTLTRTNCGTVTINETCEVNISKTDSGTTGYLCGSAFTW